MSEYIYIGGGSSSGYTFATYWEAISGPSGTVTIPAGGTIKLDFFQDLEDALISTITSGKPDFNAAVDGGGNRVVVTFDSSGNYSLSPAPASYPVAIVFRVVIPEANIDWNADNVILEDIERPGGSGSGTISGGANTGAGEGVFKDVSGASLRFKSLTGNGINITSTSNEINLAINSYMPGGW
jgi:hypothetical protein